jgi:outer membrane protein assembly factor BamB
MQPRRDDRAKVKACGRAAWAVVVATGVAVGVPAAGAAGQFGIMGDRDNPVFVNDSTAAAEALSRVADNLASGNVEQAVRLLQRLLDDDPFALVPSAGDASLFVPVRERVHAVLLRDRGLLERYRAVQGVVAGDALAKGEHAAVERARLLTPAGMAAGLRVAAEHLEAARFHAALRTLEQLCDHPDRAGEEAARARQVAGLLLRYLPTPAARDVAARLGVAGPDEGMEAWPRILESRSGLEALPGLGRLEGENGGIVSQPLATAMFAEEAGEERRGSRGLAQEGLPRFARELRTLPVVYGDLVVVSSAQSISAFDRYTLGLRWKADALELLAWAGEERVMPRTVQDRFFAGRRGFGPELEDVAVVSARSGLLVAGVSNAFLEGNEDRDAVAAVDAATGRARWVVAADEIDPRTGRAKVRGPVRVDGETVVVCLRKEGADRRPWAVYLAGLSVVDGSVKWCRLLGSIGALPYARSMQVADQNTVADGVVYRCDQMGLVAAYDTSEGRPLWVRRMASGPLELADQPTPFAGNAPLVFGSRLVVLSPDRKKVMALDRVTGAVLAEMPTDRLDRVRYLVRAGQKVAAVGDARVAFFGPELDGNLRLSARVEGSGIRGRVVGFAGEEGAAAGVDGAGGGGAGVLVPTAQGVVVVSADSPEEGARLVRLDNPGNLVAEGGQLLVADDGRVHNYLSWAEADRVLTARIAQDPSEPAAAVSLAELAHRAGHPERVKFAVEAAVAPLVGALAKGREQVGDAGGAPGAAASGLPEGLEASRSRLVASMLAMLEVAHAPERGAERADQGGPGPRVPIDLAGELVERLGSVAVTVEERAAHLLSAGRQAELTGKSSGPGGAVEVYQRLLSDAAAAAAPWRGRHLSVRAEAEATRRLEGLLQRGGRGVYAGFDAQARDEAAALGANATVEELERVARRFPVALVTPRVWARVATVHERAGRPRQAARALEIGLQVARVLPDAPRDVAGELTGRLASNFAERGLLVAASETLRSSKARFGELALTRNGVAVDATGLAAKVSDELAAARRWPAVGLPTGEGVQAFPGWTLLEPVLRPTEASTAGGVVMVSQDRRAGLFVPGSDGRMEQRWGASDLNQEVRLLRIDKDAAWLFFFTDDGGVVKRIDCKTGAETWASKPFPEHFEQKRLVQVDRFKPPIGGVQTGTNLLVCADERTIALVERSGRVVGLDADSGSVLLAVTAPVARVFDAAVQGNVLVLAGDRPNKSAGGNVVSFSPTVVLMDARSGAVTGETPLSEGQARWVRLNSRGDLVVGAERGVLGVDPETGTVNWRNAQAPCAGTLAAWVTGDALLVVAEDRALWRMSVTTGALRPEPIETRGRLMTESEPLASVTREGGFALSTAQGLVLLSGEGELRGADALAATDNMIAPLPGQGVFVTMETGSASARPGQRGGVGVGAGVVVAPPGVQAEPGTELLPYNLHLLESGSGLLRSTVPLLLAEPPSVLALIEGRVAVTAGRTTVVYKAP